VLLNVSAPFHCALLQPAASRLETVLAEISYGEFARPVISNVTAAPHPSSQEVRHWLVEQVTSPVRWVDSMQYAVAQGCDTLLEVGPGNVLSGLMRRIDRGVRVLKLDEVLEHF
jgi:[acyl-carrier-protein] S-malonyltransferase